jgi:hypothetical protein
MKRISYIGLAVIVLALGASAAQAQLTCPGSTPAANSAVISTRVFNDCPTSVLTVNNSYPAEISILDDTLDCFGGANLHTWSFSTDGLTKAQFENCSLYRFCADVTLSGTGGGEGGLRFSPWWSPDADGKFMINANTGEIACFGGRMPFYTFTVAYGLHYVKGTTVHMEIIYNPGNVSATNPAWIIYNLVIGGTHYSSGPRFFDSGNLAEGVLHGLYGELWQAYAGGYVQPTLGQGTPVNFTGDWKNICFDSDPVTPTKTTTWGTLKTLYR